MKPLLLLQRFPNKIAMSEEVKIITGNVWIKAILFKVKRGFLVNDLLKQGNLVGLTG
jgi:hypothetical protein